MKHYEFKMRSNVVCVNYKEKEGGRALGQAMEKHFLSTIKPFIEQPAEV